MARKQTSKTSKPSSTSKAAKESSKQAAQAVAKATAAKAGKAAPAPAPEETIVRKLTKRSPQNLTNTSIFVFGSKTGPSHTKPHTKEAWDAVAGAINASKGKGVVGTALLALPALQAKGCVSPQAFLSYCVRRHWLQQA